MDLPENIPLQMDRALFNLFNEHARQALGEKGWDTPQIRLYLLNASLRAHGIDCTLATQCMVDTVHGFVPLPFLGVNRCAIEFATGLVIDSEGRQGWDAIWDPYDQTTRHLLTRLTPGVEVCRAPVDPSDMDVLWEVELRHVEPSLMEALAHEVLARVQKTLLEGGTSLLMSGSATRARL